MTHKLDKVMWTAIVPAIFVLSVFPEVADAQGGDVPDRGEIDTEYTWDLTKMFPDRDAWEQAFEQCSGDVDKLASFKGALNDPDTLLEYLKTRDDFYVRLEKVFAYAMLLRDQDTRAAEPQAMFDRVQTLAVKTGEATSWYEPEVLALPDGQLLRWCDTHDGLGLYKHNFENLLRQQKHVLSAREEELLAMNGKVASTPQQAFTMLANADLSFPEIEDSEGNMVEVSEGRYMLFMQSPDRELRRRAFKGLLGAYLDYRNTIAALLAGSVQKDVFYARARHYDSALHAALDPDNVPVDVYKNLIATIHEHLPKLHRYMEIRRNKLGVDKVHLYDTFMPLIDGEPPKISYDAAVEKITAGLRPLGDEYLTPMKQGFRDRWIDVYETKGKRSGAYSMGTYASDPFILLNYNGTYNDMFTVAHEMGHSMHTWFTVHTQPPVYGDYPIFLAEVASTCNEILLDDYLRANAENDAERLYLVNQALESIRGTVINQTMWAEYEMLIHEMAEAGKPLTYETMAEVYRGLVEKYFGPAYAHDEEVDGYWTRIPHFYRGFYVYKYATSYCASVALAKRVLSGDPEQLEAYLGFLKSGSSAYPIDILKKAGVDMSTPAPIHATMELFGELLDEMETLLARSEGASSTPVSAAN